MGGGEIPTICTISPRREESHSFVLCADDKCNKAGRTTACQWNVYSKYMRIIYFRGDNNMQLCLYLPSCHTSRTTGRAMMDSEETKTISALNPLTADNYRSLSLCQSTSIQQGTIYPLGWAVVWMGSASFLFLRTNRVIIPSRREDEAIKHAREGFFFYVLRCLGCNYSARRVTLYLSVSVESGVALVCRYAKESRGVFSRNRELKQAEAKVSRWVLICLSS